MSTTDENNTKNNEVKAQVPFSPSLLKSAIQKSVRRGDVDRAVRTAKSLIQLNEVDALRRLMIIPIEDCILPPDYDKYAAMLTKVSSKGSVPLTEAEKTMALSIIADVARCEWRDLDVGNPDDEGKDYAMQPVQGNKENDLVNALLYRQRIGGSYWDRIMLAQMARVWNRRFAEKTWDIEKLESYFSGQAIDWNDVPYATVDDIMLEVVDMHCSGILQMLLKIDWVKDLIRKEIPFNKRDWLGSDMSDHNLLEQIMWCTRSSINYKKNVWETVAGKDRPVSWLFADKVPEEMWPVYEHITELTKEETDNISRWVIAKQGGNK
ncbi:MAG TPA: hypothetical protein VMR18_00785 [Candidatus Saccharimonadales bacterium]|nr:hypothetical protein [Candidatus Saccharimonadales bacterium]